MPRYDFSCERGHRFEQEAARDAFAASCSCGAPAERLLAVPHTITGERAVTPKGQRAVPMGEYREAAAQLDYEFKRERDIRQTELSEPPLWMDARKAAGAVLAGKRKPPKGWKPVSFA